MVDANEVISVIAVISGWRHDIGWFEVDSMVLYDSKDKLENG